MVCGACGHSFRYMWEQDVDAGARRTWLNQRHWMEIKQWNEGRWIMGPGLLEVNK
jgi:hypothetical protein